MTDRDATPNWPRPWAKPIQRYTMTSLPGINFVLSEDYEALVTETARAACHSGKDGDCVWAACPQIADGEPVATGRHCPLDWRKDDD